MTISFYTGTTCIYSYTTNQSPSMNRPYAIPNNGDIIHIEDVSITKAFEVIARHIIYESNGYQEVRLGVMEV